MRRKPFLSKTNYLNTGTQRLTTACAVRLLPLLLLLLIPAAAQAEDFLWLDNGDGTCTITEYTGHGGAVAIPDTFSGLTVTTIGDSTFYRCTSLTSITIPDSVTTIGGEAFYFCTSLTSVTIPDSVTTIGYAAFRDCTSLASVTIPDSVTSIGYAVFRDCTSLASVTIPDSVTAIGGEAFYFCTSLTSVMIGNSVTSIGYAAFRDCTSLTSVTIPDSVTTIGNYAFDNCDGLTSVTIGNSVTSIGDGMFYFCTSLTSITIPDSVTSIGDYAFLYCTGLTSVTIGNSVTSIGYAMFYNCTSLTRITIPDSVTSIGYAMFYNCTSLTRITIPDSVTSIEDYAFLDCTGLTSVTIGNSVTSIGDFAFAYCDSLTGVYFKGNVPSLGPATAPSFLDNDNATVYYLPWIAWPATFGGLPTAPWLLVEADLDIDYQVNFTDFAIFSDKWLKTDCQGANNWCDGADFDFSGSVDPLDLALLAEHWLDSHLIGCWALNETTGSLASDSASNGYDGTLMNMDNSDWVTGKTGNALDFDGVDDYVEITEDGGLNPDIDSWSVAFWMKSDTADQGVFMISKRGNTAPYTQYSIGLSTGNSYSWAAGSKLTFLFRETTGKEKGGYTTSDIHFSDWTHVCVILNRGANTVYVYINGVSVPVTLDHDGALPTINNTSPLYVGGNPTVSGQYYQGLMDDIRIYYKALTEQEILKLSQ